MKKNILVFLLMSLLIFDAISQSIQITSKPLDKANFKKLGKEFKKFQVFEITTDTWHNIENSNSNNIDIDLTLSQLNFKIFLEDNKHLTEKMITEEITKNGIQKRENISGRNFKGGIRDGSSSQVRMSIDNGTLEVLMIQLNTTTYYLEPVKNFIKEALQSQYVLYEAASVKNKKVSCYYNNSQKKIPGINSLQIQGNEAQGAPRSSCEIVEIASVGDYSMVIKYGSSNAVNNHIAAIYNLAEANYSGFNLQFQIVYQTTSSCSSCDPWTTSTNSGDVLNSFNSWAASNLSVQHDMGSFWTDRGLDNGIIGIADAQFAQGSNYGTCQTYKYCIIDDYSSDAQEMRALLAHEHGHNFNAQHDPSGTSYIMTQGNSGSFVNFSPTSINAISNYISTISCLGPCTSNAGDDCSSPIVLTSNVSCIPYSSTVTGATSSGLTIPYCSNSQSATALDRWFSFVAQYSSETVTIDPIGNTNSNAYLDAVIALYSSCSSNSLIDCFDETNPNGGGVTTTHTFTGLTSQNTYFIRVFDWGSSQPANGGFDICVTHSGGAVPSTPTNLNLTAQSCSSAIGTWSACTNNPTGYEVYLNNNYYATTNNTSYTFNGLNPNTSYFLTVVAFNNVGYGNGSAQSNTETTPPCVTSCSSSPSSLQVTAGQTSAGISWNADPDASTYTVSYRILGGAWNPDDITSLPSYNLSNLNCNTYYEFRVKTNCWQGTTSGYSSSTFTTTSCGGTSCSSSPGSLQATTTQTTASLSWNADPDASTYTVNYRLAGGTWSADDVTSLTSYNLSGLNCNAQYEFRVKTNCWQGTSSGYSSRGFITASCGSSNCSNSPSNLQITPSTNGASISWNADPDASNYTINYRIAGGTWSPNDVTGAPWYDLFGLSCNTQYEFRVKTNCVQGNSSGYSSNFFYTLDCCPSAPQLVYPGDYSTIYGNDIVFQWYEVPGATGYAFEISRDAYFNTVECCNSPSFYTTGNIINASLNTFSQDGTCYFWRVKSLGNSCNSTFSPKYRFYSGDCANSYAPTPILYYPIDGSNQCAYGDTVYYNWSATSCALNYQFQLSSSSNFSGSNILDDYTSSYFSIWNQASYYSQSGGIFYWRVREQNNYGWSGWSNYNYFINSCLTGMEELDSKSLQLLIFPNPTNGSFSMSFLSQQGVPYLIRIYDMEGRLVQSRSGISITEQAKEEFNVEELSRGVYVIQLQQKDKFVSSRFSKL